MQPMYQCVLTQVRKTPVITQTTRVRRFVAASIYCARTLHPVGPHLTPPGVPGRCACPLAGASVVVHRAGLASGRSSGCRAPAPKLALAESSDFEAWVGDAVLDPALDRLGWGGRCRGVRCGRDTEGDPCMARLDRPREGSTMQLTGVAPNSDEVALEPCAGSEAACLGSHDRGERRSCCAASVPPPSAQVLEALTWGAEAPCVAVACSGGWRSRLEETCASLPQVAPDHRPGRPRSSAVLGRSLFSMARRDS